MFRRYSDADEESWAGAPWKFSRKGVGGCADGAADPSPAVGRLSIREKKQHLDLVSI
jgi:hypothetical protein